jgi:hypothetical protein
MLYSTERFSFRRPSRLVALFGLLACLYSSAHAQVGARTITRGLDQLTDEAAIIVQGHIQSVKFEPHPQLTNLNTIVVSMYVRTTLKGTQRKTLTFRQFVWDGDPVRAAKDYAKGEELLLLLGPTSEYGLSSPVGLEQGRFRVTHDRQGNSVVANGRNNVGLFTSIMKRTRSKGVALSPLTAVMTERAAGPVPLNDLQDLIRTLAGTKK